MGQILLRNFTPLNFRGLLCVSVLCTGVSAFCQSAPEMTADPQEPPPAVKFESDFLNISGASATPVEVLGASSVGNGDALPPSSLTPTDPLGLSDFSISLGGIVGAIVTDPGGDPSSTGGSVPPVAPFDGTQIFNVVSADALLSATVGDSNLLLRTTGKYAAAVTSIRWRNQEFVDSQDHGREFQSALSFDYWGECLNPTEAGSGSDGEISTSQVLDLETSADGPPTLIGKTQMAYWVRAGTTYLPKGGCSAQHPQHFGANTANLSGETLKRRIQIGYGAFDNVIEYQTTFTIPESGHTFMTLETLTGYMPLDFSRLYQFDLTQSRLKSQDLTKLPSVSANLPVFATQDGSKAIGVLAIPSGLNEEYVQYHFPQGQGATNKWSISRQKYNNVPTGDYPFDQFLVIESLPEVVHTLIPLSNQVLRLQDGLTSDPIEVDPNLNWKPVYSLFSPARHDRRLTTASGEISALRAYGYRLIHADSDLQSQAPAFQILTLNPGRNGVPLYQCTFEQRQYISVSSDCDKFGSADRQLGFALSTNFVGSSPLVRLFHPQNRDHILTTKPDYWLGQGYRLEATLGFVKSLP